MTLLIGVLQLHNMDNKKIAHRDIKPDNILFFNNVIPIKLSDFGVAMEYEN